MINHFPATNAYYSTLGADSAAVNAVVACDAALLAAFEKAVLITPATVPKTTRVKIMPNKEPLISDIISPPF